MQCPRAYLALVLAGTLLFAASAAAQQTPATHQAAGTQQAPSAQQPGSSGITLKANAQLVILDVVVTDSARRPVHGLKAGDFTVSEGNVQQAINHFEEHSTPTAAEAAKFAPMPKLPPDIFTNYSPAPIGGAVNILLLDSLNTPLVDQTFMRAQFLKYLKTVRAGTRIAIFGLTTKRLTLLQGFTSDPELLKDAMVQASSAKASALLKKSTDSTDQHSGDQELMDALKFQATSDPGAAELAASVGQFEAGRQDLSLDLRTKYTLDAFNQIARFAAGMPGRKNLIWFSASFPLNIFGGRNAGAEGKLRDTANLLARSQVAVYPIDVRGLIAEPNISASVGRNFLPGPQGVIAETDDVHRTMREMATATGGRAFVDSNGLAEAVAAAIDDGSNFYTLTYTPTNSKRDGKLREIKVRAPAGLSLSYRQSYYADTPDNPKNPPPARLVEAAATTATSAGAPSLDSLHSAMMHGAPTPTQIVLKAGVVPLGLAEDNSAPGKKTLTANRRYAINYGIDATDLFVRGADGAMHADLDLIIFVFDVDGKLINSHGKRVHLTATPEEAREMLAHGIYHHEEIDVPGQAESFLRIAVRDLHRDRYGAIEVATSQIKNIVLPAPPAGAKR